jgi:RsiW-degrading membrane proteinase PrsW (M82 family)
MREISIKDTCLVGITQAAVITGGVVLAGLSDKRFLNWGQPTPQVLSVVADYGALALAFPLLWTIISLRLRHSTAPANTKITMFYFGLILVVMLALFICYVLARSYFAIDWSIENGRDA